MVLVGSIWEQKPLDSFFMPGELTIICEGHYGLVEWILCYCP